MNKLLPLLKNPLKARRFSILMGLVLFISLIATNDIKAQIYYVTNDAAPTSAGSGDGIARMGYDGSGSTVLASSITTSPSLLQIDYANNRAFVYEGYQPDPVPNPNPLSIKVINLTNGTVIRSIPLAVVGRATSLKYDPVNDYIYYVTGDPLAADAANATSNDALIRVKPDGTGSTILASGFCKNPAFLALNIANNEIYVYQNLYADPRIYVLNLSGGVIRNFGTIADKPSAPFVSVDMAYDNINNYIYYLTSDNGDGNSVKDALKRINIDGTGETTIASNIGGGVIYAMSIDPGHNKAYFFDKAATANRGINSVDLTTGSVSLVKSIASPTLISGLAIPSLPVISTTAVSTYSGSSATMGGNITRSDVSVTDRGVVYSSSNSAPTIGGSGVTQATNGTGSGSFSASVSGLSASTTYYIRAYATSAAGTSYGAVTTFATLSNDASLSGFTLSQGTLNPSFSAGTTSYTASVSNATTSITVTPTRNQGSATIKVNGVAVTSGSASGAVALNVGSNTITTVVTAQDGTTTKTYTVTVTRAQNPQTITFNALPAKTYGDADFAPGATSSAGLTVAYSSDNTAVATIVNSQVHIVGVGTANITASQAGDASTLAANNVVQSLTVGAKTITVTANAQTVVYGNNDPALTYTVTGVVGSDAPTGALVRADGRLVGSYAITQGTLSYGSKYNVNFVGANLTVSKRPITVLPVGKTKVYGDADPFLNQFSVTGGSIASGDATGDQFGRAPGENVGTYLMTLGNKKFYGNINGTFQDVTSNYDVTVQPAYVTITPKPVTVNAYSQTKTFGDADPALTYVNSSLAFSDTFTGALTRTAGENAGTYAINQGTLTLGGNYTIAYVGSNLTIAAKTINVAANAQTKAYGDADPTLTYTADALVNGDTFSGTLGRDAGEALGSYVIKQGTLALSSNYAIAFTGSSLTIGAKNITVIANAKTKVYGNADPELTYTTDVPLVNGNSFTGSLTRNEGKNVGDYAITQGTLALNSNYNVTFTSANLTITKRPIGIAPVPRTKVYGDPNPNIPYQLTGTVAPGEGMTGQFEIAGGENVGEHAILIGGKTPIDIGTATNTINNYDITFTPGVLTITAKPITVTADAKTKTFGEADPALTYTTNVPLAYSDAFTGELTRDAGENIGSYAITQGTLALSTNYNVTYGGSNLTITPSTNANLSSLVFADMDVTPSFSSEVTSYSAEVDPYFFQVAVIPTAAQANAHISVNGTSVPNGQTQYIPLYSGPNTINTVVTAQDGTTTKTYTTVVTKKLDTDAKLAALFFFNGGTTLSPDFDPDVHNYTMDVPHSTTSLRIAPYANSVFATINVNGVAYNGYMYPYLQDGSNVFTIKVIAEDPSISETYTLTINRALSSNNSLYNLTLTNATISPEFNTNTLNYTASVDNGTYSAALQAYPADTTARYKINGVAPNNPWESVPVDFNTGENHFNIDVTAKNGDVKQYTLVVTRALSTNSSLSNLTVSNGTLTPYFEGQTGPFAVTVPFSLSTIRVTPTLQEPYSTVTVNGTEVVSGSPSQDIALNYGDNQINVVATAQDGITTSQYTIIVTRPAPSDNAKLTLKLNPNSTLTATTGTAKSNYVTSVTPDVTSVLLTPTAQDANASITVNGSPAVSGAPFGPIPLSEGATMIDISATAQDGVTVRTYSITINRLGSSNAAATFKASGATLVKTTGSANVNYTTSVDPAAGSITITPEAENAGASILINGVAVANGTASAPIALGAGSTTINAVVTAQDGTTTKTYSITVNRTGSNSTWVGLKLTPAATLASTTTGTANVNYTTSVDAALSSVTLTATESTGATILVNGVAVRSGVPSDPIALNAGATVINVDVTAQDGVTTKSYSITVNRTGSSNASAGFKLSPLAVLTSTTGTAGTNYVTSVTADVTSLMLTPTAQDANASITVNGSPAVSGTPFGPISLDDVATMINISVTAPDGVTIRTYSIKVNRSGSSNAAATFKASGATLVKTTGSANVNYTTSVDPAASSITITPEAENAGASILINGVAVANGTASAPIALGAGSTTINAVVTAQDGTTTKTYSITVNRTGSNSTWVGLKLTPAATLASTTTGTANVNYTTSVDAALSSVTLTATESTGATILVNGVAVSSGVPSDPIALNAGATVINVDVTAQDGVTTKSYSITVNRTGSSDVTASFKLTPSTTMTTTTGTADKNYAASVTEGTANIAVIPKLNNAGATVTINGVLVANKVASYPIALNPGLNIINAVVTAQNGTTTKTYNIYVTRQGGSIMVNKADRNLFYTNKSNNGIAARESDIIVHAAVSPNGDGSNDFLVIEGLSDFANNKLSIMNTSGNLVYETKDYGKDGTNVFDGHSNKNGALLKPGTYYYQLEYQGVDKTTKRKTGYVIVKY